MERVRAFASNSVQDKDNLRKSLSPNAQKFLAEQDQLQSARAGEEFNIG